jgi:regulator of sigma E protease
VAGVTLNFALAWFLISINLIMGMPVGLDGLPAGLKVKNESLAVVNVLKDSPASKAGLQVGDSLVSLKSGVNLRENLTPESVKDFVLNQRNNDIIIKYQRGDSQEEILVKTEGELLGIAMARIGLVSLPWWQAPVYSFYFTYHLSANTLSSLGYFAKSLVTDSKTALTAVAGPIGIYSLMADAERLGLVYFLNFVAMISINLAILNLLPFPALDGGRLLFVAIEAIIRRPIKPVVANTLNLIGFSLLIILMVIIAGSDILKLL